MSASLEKEVQRVDDRMNDDRMVIANVERAAALKSHAQPSPHGAAVGWSAAAMAGVGRLGAGAVLTCHGLLSMAVAPDGGRRPTPTPPSAVG